MGKNDVSDSGSDSEDEERESEENPSSGEGEEEESENGGKSSDGRQGLTDYEKQRLSRIAQNKARMEALGLSKMATSFMGSVQKSSQQRKGKKKAVGDDDEDYRPMDDANADEDDDDDDFDDDKDDEDFKGSHSSSKSRKQKVRNKGSRAKKASAQKKISTAHYVDEDGDLMKAIALSLQDCNKSEGPKERRENVHGQDDNQRKKRRKPFASRVQMTEDELILHFFQFDEAGKGNITIRDLERISIAHDFTWTDKELADMIYCFDSNGDGKLDLEDFHKIVDRCNMIRGSENH